MISNILKDKMTKICLSDFYLLMLMLNLFKMCKSLLFRIVYANVNEEFIQNVSFKQQILFILLLMNLFKLGNLNNNYYYWWIYSMPNMNYYSSVGTQ